jgi:hypothetical protein
VLLMAQREHEDLCPMEKRRTCLLDSRFGAL